MKQNNNFLVCVKCITYNHASFITDAMNGFSMQQTNFPFACTIIDDASTDGEQDVILKYLSDNFQTPYRTEETEYAHIICAKHMNNTNCEFVAILLKYNHYKAKKKKLPYISEWLDNAKYVAMCEGDDYWTLPDKLQMQVEFLEKNLSYTMCFHNADIKYEDGIKLAKGVLDKPYEEKDYTASELLHHRPPTASLVFRNVQFPSDPRFLFGDNVIFLTCATKGKVHGFSQTMSVYRRHVGGVTVSMHHPFIKRAQNRYALMQYFPSCMDVLKTRMAKDLAYSLLFRKNDRKDVIKYLFSNPQSIILLIKGIIRIIKHKH